MHYNKKIPLGQEKIQLIIKSFEDGEYEYFECFKEHPTVTHNGRGATIWNHIHTQLVKNFSMPGYKTGIISRGIWDLIYIFDEDTKYLYTFMREVNFVNLHTGDMQDRLFHYSNILSKLNGQLLDTYEPEYQQMRFVDVITRDDDTDTKLELLLQILVDSIDEKIERYAIVLVDCKHGMVKHIECVIPIAYMNPVYREDWSKYIRAEYVTDSYHVEETKPDDNEVILFETNSDINLSFREDNEEQKKVK